MLIRVAAVGVAFLTFAAGACGGKDHPAAAADGGAAEASAARASTAPDTSVSEKSGSPETPDTPIGRGGAIEMYPAAVLSGIADRLARGPTTAKTVVARPTFHYVQARRSSNGMPEVHDRWIDVTIVQAGRATLLVGGRVNGSRLASPGEHRGGTIIGGSPRVIGAGDLFTIPAGVPHQFQVASGDTVRYLTIKVAQPEAGRP